MFSFFSFCMHLFYFSASVPSMRNKTKEVCTEPPSSALSTTLPAFDRAEFGRTVGLGLGTRLRDVFCMGPCPTQRWDGMDRVRPWIVLGQVGSKTLVVW